MSDELHLLQRIGAGDVLAFGQWVAGVELPLRLSLRRFAKVLDTEAVLQEALLRVWQVAPRFVSDGGPNALLRFAVITARNVAVSELRRSPVPGELIERDEPTVSASEPDPHLRAAVAACHAKLPGQPREAIGARLESGGVDDDATIAQRLGMKVNTFLQNVTRARKLIAECLKKRGIDLDAELSP